MFYRIAAEQGWSPETQVEVLLAYIENQDSPEAFERFLSEQVDVEVAMSKEFEEVVFAGAVCKVYVGDEPVRILTENGHMLTRQEDGRYVEKDLSFESLADVKVKWVQVKAMALFRPQAWVDDWAVDADPDGPQIYDISPELVAMGVDAAMQIKDLTNESDEFKDAKNAPDWVKEWSGPFEVDVEDAILDFFWPEREENACSK